MRKSGTTGATNGGFSLIELMVAVVIVAILAGIAYPNYKSYVAQARRTDATSNLMRAAAQQTNFYGHCGVYTNLFGGNIAACTGLGMDQLANNATYTTPDGHYILSVPILLAGPPPLNRPNGGGFTLSAAPNPLSSQNATDSAKCATFTIDQTGAKGATGSDGGLNGGKCWKK